MKNIILLFLLLSTTTCIKKEPFPDKLPDATTYGANTLGCRINNEIFIPKVTIFSKISGAISLVFPYKPSYFCKISAKRETNNDKDVTNHGSVFLEVTSLKDVGRYSLSRGEVKFNGVYYKLDSATSKDEILITKLDTVAKIVCGTFNFSAVGDDKNTITVSEGRFDLKSNAQ